MARFNPIYKLCVQTVNNKTIEIDVRNIKKGQLPNLNLTEVSTVNLFDIDNLVFKNKSNIKHESDFIVYLKSLGYNVNFHDKVYTKYSVPPRVSSDNGFRTADMFYKDSMTLSYFANVLNYSKSIHDLEDDKIYQMFVKQFYKSIEDRDFTNYMIDSNYIDTYDAEFVDKYSYYTNSIKDITNTIIKLEQQADKCEYGSHKQFDILALIEDEKLKREVEYEKLDQPHTSEKIDDAILSYAFLRKVIIGIYEYQKITSPEKFKSAKELLIVDNIYEDIEKNNADNEDRNKLLFDSIGTGELLDAVNEGAISHVNYESMIDAYKKQVRAIKEISKENNSFNDASIFDQYSGNNEYDNRRMGR